MRERKGWMLKFPFICFVVTLKNIWLAWHWDHIYSANILWKSRRMKKNQYWMPLFDVTKKVTYMVFFKDDSWKISGQDTAWKARLCLGACMWAGKSGTFSADALRLWKKLPAERHKYSVLLCVKDLVFNAFLLGFLRWLLFRCSVGSVGVHLWGFF